MNSALQTRFAREGQIELCLHLKSLNVHSSADSHAGCSDRRSIFLTPPQHRPSFLSHTYSHPSAF
jgi:hypothetical protein